MVEMTTAMSLYFLRLTPIACAAEVLLFIAIIALPMGLRIRFDVRSMSRMKVKVMSRYTAFSLTFTPKR